MPTLHLGVIDVPYEDSEGVTTGDVAEWLESKYNVMQVFFETYQTQIAGFMADSLAGALENIVAGAPPGGDPLLEAMDKTHALFVTFLEKEEMNGRAGIPTKRALDGISKRFKNKKGQPRPSFIDTGLYEASMRAWVTGVLDAFDQ